jgi:hypothetical protein
MEATFVGVAIRTRSNTRSTFGRESIEPAAQCPSEQKETSMPKTTQAVFRATASLPGARAWRYKAVRVMTAGLFAAQVFTAEAALIDFEELQLTNPQGDLDFYSNPIPEQTYASQGVLITDGYLWPADHRSGQSLRPSDNTRFTFTGTLPTFVSLTVLWLPEDILNIDASGPSDWTSRFHSWGYEHGPNVPPNFGNRVISFASLTGISSISFADSSFMRFPAYIDSIYVGAVPAPASAALLGAGLVALWVRRRRCKD